MRPALLAMDWRDAVFIHWPVDVASLRRLIPAGLEIDTYDGAGWVSIVAFRIAAARPCGLPPPMGLPAFGEINLRTYVSRPEKPGVWFFELDADSALAVAAGRRLVHLPYQRAKIAPAWSATGATYRSERFAAEAAFGGDVRVSAPGTLDRWLVERYCFYTVDPRGRIARGDVAHPPWLVRDARVSIERNALLGAYGLEALASEPLVHVSPGVAVRAWPLAVSPDGPADRAR